MELHLGDDRKFIFSFLFKLIFLQLLDVGRTRIRSLECRMAVYFNLYFRLGMCCGKITYLISTNTFKTQPCRISKRFRAKEILYFYFILFFLNIRALKEFQHP